MNRRLLVAISLSFLSVWAFQYFTGKKEAPSAAAGQAGVRPGQFYTAPVRQEWHREPNREIDFVDKPLSKDQEKRAVVQTPLVTVHFSSFGGVIQSLEFKKHKGKQQPHLISVTSNVMTQREEGCFLLALDEKTPYQYELLSQKQANGVHEVVFQTRADTWLIRKTYLIYDALYKIDLRLDFEPSKKGAKPIHPRLFFPSPQLFEVPDNKVNGVLSRNGLSIEKLSQSKEREGVLGLPEFFGTEDKYFAHTLIKDQKNFSQGGYYKRVGTTLFSILEGPEITEKKGWNLSFYFGPKLLGDLSAVDERLVDLLSFGWLSWVCKLLLKFLEFLYKHVGNFGLAIILLTILLKLPFIPLSMSTKRKMEEYQKYQPTITRIRNKYRGDQVKQHEEVMRFHQEHNLSATTPMMGCLPFLIQIPILFALYRVLGSYLSLYQAPFIGWVTDLSSPDPYYVLPILMGVSMLWQQTLSPVGDPKQRTMMMFMPIVMTAVFINFPAGLVLYWFVNNLLTVGEDLFRKKVLG